MSEMYENPTGKVDRDEVSYSYSSIIQEPLRYFFPLYSLWSVVVETALFAHLKSEVFFSTFNGRPPKFLSTSFVRLRGCGPEQFLKVSRCRV